MFKNDQDTWDYTNPNLSSQGTVYPTSALTFLSALTATVGKIIGWDWGILQPQQQIRCFIPLCWELGIRLYRPTSTPHVVYVFLTLWGRIKKPYLCDLAKASSECCPSDISQASFSSKVRHMSVMWGASGFLGKHHVGGLSVNGLLVHILWSTWNYDWKPFDFSRWSEIQGKNGGELDFVRCKCIELKKNWIRIGDIAQNGKSFCCSSE